MRQYLPRDRAVAARAELERRCASEAAKRQAANAARLAKKRGYVDYLAGDEIHMLWSDGKSDGTFENNHGCWSLFATVE